MEKRWLGEALPLAVERLLQRLFENAQQAKAYNQISIARLDYCLPMFKVCPSKQTLGPFQLARSLFRMWLLILNVPTNGSPRF